MPEAAIFLALVGASVVGALRWLRIIQRDQYYPAAMRFARRWWLSTPLNTILLVVGVGSAALAWLTPWAGLATAGVVLIGPFGLAIRSRAAPLAWTGRLIRLALVVAVGGSSVAAALTLLRGAMGAAAVAAAVWALALTALGLPLVVDAATLIARPLERRLLEVYIGRARQRLTAVEPRVVAITGSFGKTSTKAYLRQLLAPVRSVVASPASFNNPAGLARTINEQLVTGTDVFVAEMGTYGPGEIRDMCRWLAPEVALITAIGPVHLERMGTLEAIVAAKAEITERAATCVLNVDAPGLAALADQLAATRTVWRCSTQDPTADVHVRRDGDQLTVSVRGAVLARVTNADAQPGNVACAVAAALALEVPPEVIAGVLPALAAPEHRQQVASAANGATIIDDTYNSNPAGAAAALGRLARLPARRRVLVTPGMIELGAIQARENEAFARAAAAEVDDLVIVARTNRSALSRGAAGGRATVHLVDTREQAVAWVRANIGPTDAVLYENDLPDVYP